MTEHAPGRFWSGIDIPKTIAGVLAAVSAAVIGSFLGVAGTLIGAAVASLIGSVGTEVYHRSIDRGRKKIVGTFLTAPAAVGTPEVAAAAEETPSEQAVSRGKIRWRRVAMVAGAVFVLAMGTLTVAEIVSGRSIADATRGGTGDRSTLSRLFTSSDSSDSDRENPAPATSTDPSGDDPATTGPGGAATTAPTEAPATEPGGGATTEPDTDSPTGSPTGGAADPGTGSDSGPNSGPDPGVADPLGADTRNPDNGTE
ncbi:hypothetical protein [Paractinoplanes rishiriensis]|uniref:Uncharacterized protein n=1 Tax=Paractinoplanes rishiriensis TaxID=1050105 RepID=A0A919MSF0_9ACTN|nr:hypothetical protein [Actinoplanes rishiriensis]GIE93129.1 hypothetical protein Ari01nite_05940 [Actinoplanes rishiriensis]